jgi:ribosomal protein S18 acetylase RimI-like enzyme
MEYIADKKFDESQKMKSKRKFWGSNNESGRQDKKIVGYVLGKVDEIPSTRILPLRPSKVKVHDDDDDEKFYSQLFNEEKELLGHVTSLAILKEFRRRGLAAELMHQLHFHLCKFYEADAVGLHVRVSNVAATKLYSKTMGYQVIDIIKGYYQDGEDAFFMKKSLLQKDFLREKRFYQGFEFPRRIEWKKNDSKDEKSHFVFSQNNGKSLIANGF